MAPETECGELCQVFLIVFSKRHSRLCSSHPCAAWNVLSSYLSRKTERNLFHSSNMFKWTRTERAVRTKWRVTSYILFRHIVICAFQEADEVKCQYTQLKLSRQSNHPTLSLQPMAQRESEWRGIPAMTPCLGKAWKSQTAKS